MAGHPPKPPEVPQPGPDDPHHTAFGEYSSPPCFMHELDPAFSRSEAHPHLPSKTPLVELEELDWPGIRRWRKETRAALIEQRLQISANERVARSLRISQALKSILSSKSDKLVGFYWPFRGEFDARPLLTEERGRGMRLALPVVVDKGQPLQFRAWSPGTRMTRGVWNIPIPADDEAVEPDVLIAPLVGFDPAGYRLGYGGGFYDRTIASKAVKPFVIGIGFEITRLPTIHPQPHDIPMDVIITDTDAWSRPAAGTPSCSDLRP